MYAVLSSPGQCQSVPNKKKGHARLCSGARSRGGARSPGAARARRYLGQINPTDFFTRLLAGVVYTRLAPASFYKDPSGPDRHFDGMCAARGWTRASLPAACLLQGCALPACPGHHCSGESAGLFAMYLKN